MIYSLAGEEGLLKVGLHHAGPEARPNEAGEPSMDAVSAMAEWAARTFSLAGPEPVRSETCLYTSTADERFLLERHGPLVVGSPCSGHGFKFAPAVGVRLAGLAAETL